MSTPEVKKTITQVDKSTKAIAKVTADMAKIATDLTTLVSTSEDLSFDIESKASELASLEVQIKEAERTATAELNIRVLENEDGVLAGLMRKRGLAAITQEKLNILESDLSSAQSDNADAIETAVSQAESNAAIKHNASKSTQEANHQVATAKLEADNSSLQDKVIFLESSVADLKGIIDSEREARVAMAASSSAPTINVGAK